MSLVAYSTSRQIDNTTKGDKSREIIAVSVRRSVDRQLQSLREKWEVETDLELAFGLAIQISSRIPREKK
jgi:formylmethanofuran dehydrogenase subunit B